MMGCDLMLRIAHSTIIRTITGDSALALTSAGMRWKHRGADAILALRCLVLNRQYDDIRRFAKPAA